MRTQQNACVVLQDSFVVLPQTKMECLSAQINKNVCIHLRMFFNVSQRPTTCRLGNGGLTFCWQASSRPPLSTLVRPESTNTELYWWKWWWNFSRRFQLTGIDEVAALTRGRTHASKDTQTTTNEHWLWLSSCVHLVHRRVLIYSDKLYIHMDVAVGEAYEYSGVEYVVLGHYAHGEYVLIYISIVSGPRSAQKSHIYHYTGSAT